MTLNWNYTLAERRARRLRRVEGNFGAKPQIEICEMDSSAPEFSHPLFCCFATSIPVSWPTHSISRRILPIQISGCIITYDCYCSVQVSICPTISTIRLEWTKRTRTVSLPAPARDTQGPQRFHQVWTLFRKLNSLWGSSVCRKLSFVL